MSAEAECITKAQTVSPPEEDFQKTARASSTGALAPFRRVVDDRTPRKQNEKQRRRAARAALREEDGKW
jgi:hypothetical protein